MSRIVINTEGLKTNVHTIEGRYSELRQLNTEFQSLLNEIEDGWKGNACAAYIRMMTNYLDQARTMERALLELKKYAQEVSTRFTELDNKAARILRS